MLRRNYAVIGGAVVTLTNVDTGQSRQTVSSQVGSYNLPTVQPGTW
jgi:hypothetical protein